MVPLLGAVCVKVVCGSVGTKRFVVRSLLLYDAPAMLCVAAQEEKKVKEGYKSAHSNSKHGSIYLPTGSSSNM